VPVPVYPKIENIPPRPILSVKIGMEPVPGPVAQAYIEAIVQLQTYAMQLETIINAINKQGETDSAK
jgi:hypothetical protein